MIPVSFFSGWGVHRDGGSGDCLSFYCFLRFAEVFWLGCCLLHLSPPSFPGAFGFIAKETNVRAPCPLGFLIKFLQLIPSLGLMSPEGASWSKGLHCDAEKRGADPCPAAAPSAAQLLRPQFKDPQP